MNQPRYSLPQRLIHWIVAIIVFGALASGFVLYAYGFNGLKNAYGLGVTNFVYKYHKTFGLIILMLMTLRIVARIRYGHPAYDPPLSSLEAWLSKGVHHLLYIALLAQPLLGWLATSAGGFPAEFFNWTFPSLIGKNKALSEALYGWHGWVGLLIFVLLVLHIAGAMKHWLINRDTVMQRMSLL